MQRLRKPSGRLHLKRVNEVADLGKTIFKLRYVELYSTNRSDLTLFLLVKSGYSMQINILVFALHLDLLKSV